MQTTSLRQLSGGQCPMKLLCVVELVYVGFIGLRDAWPFQPQAQGRLLLEAQ